MDPLTLGIGAVGLGLQAAGILGGASNAKRAAEIQNQIGGLEQNLNGQRKMAMELSAKRQSMEIYRTAQRARALALNNATNQGAAYGNSSGLAGGYGQISGQTTTNLNGVNQNLMIGRDIFGINDQISQAKMQLASVQGDQSLFQGLGSLGGAITGSAGTLSNIYQYANAPSGPITLGGPMGPTPFSSTYGQRV